MFSSRPLFDYITKKDFIKIKKFAKGKKTPFLVIDLKKIEEKYDELTKNMPYAKIYYAVKANPEDDIIKLLARKGSNFDVATIYELDQLLRLKISPKEYLLATQSKRRRYSLCLQERH